MLTTALAYLLYEYYEGLKTPAVIMVWEIVDEVMERYGQMNTHRNEETRSHFMASLFNKIVCLFGHAIVNKPKRILATAV
jgi:hypothetical protein